jgi:hypothetical protein
MFAPGPSVSPCRSPYKILELLAVIRFAQLTQYTGFDLANTLTREAQCIANLL